MGIIENGKAYQKKAEADEKRRAKNTALAAEIVNRRMQVLKYRDKLTNEEISKTISAESPTLWAAYNKGSDLDEKELETTSKFYNFE
jgi:hypothetical protein